MTQAAAGAVKGGITVADQCLPMIDYGKGVYLCDKDGHQYIDGSSGPAVYSVGHGNEEVNEAISRQLTRVAHGYRYLFTSDPLEELTELIRTSCGAVEGPIWNDLSTSLQERNVCGTPVVGKGHKLFEIVSVRSPGVRIVAVREPFCLRRHIGELREFCGSQCPSGQRNWSRREVFQGH